MFSIQKTEGAVILVEPNNQISKEMNSKMSKEISEIYFMGNIFYATSIGIFICYKCYVVWHSRRLFWTAICKIQDQHTGKLPKESFNIKKKRLKELSGNQTIRNYSLFGFHWR